MRDTRKTIVSILLDNIVNLFSLAIIVLLVVFFINKNYLYIIPLFFMIITIVINTIVDIKSYGLKKKTGEKVHILIDGEEHESRLGELKEGHDVILYPNEIVNFVGRVKSGIIVVNESDVNGSVRIVKKTVGESIKKNSLVISGNGIVSVISLGNGLNKRSHVTRSELSKKLKIFNTVFSIITLAFVLISFIFDKNNETDTLNIISKLSIISLPCLLNFIITLFLLLEIKRLHIDDVQLLDKTVLSSLNSIDAVCIDKTGTLSTGEYEVFKTIPIVKNAFLSVSTDVDRGFDQLVSNILKSTKENVGLYSALQKHFIYDISRIVEEISPISKNGLYSAITIKGGVSYALGEPENFEIVNSESAYSFIDEYRANGYQVLLLVESKNPLKLGLIEGKSQGIGIIVIQEKIRNSISELIKYCIEHNKIVKVISGDDKAVVAEISRKAGLENQNKVASVEKMPFEKLDLLIDEYVVFANASASQKRHIISFLQHQGHKVAYIGNGDNDTQALKAADVSISVAGSTDNAIKCSQIAMKSDFKSKKEIFREATLQHNKIENILSLFFSQGIFISFAIAFFFIAHLINNEIVNPFGIHQLLLWILFGSLIPSVVLLLEPNPVENPTRSFYRNLLLESLVYILPVLTIFVLQMMQRNGMGYFAVPCDRNEFHELTYQSSVANSMYPLSLLAASLFVVYGHLQPFNKNRIIMFIAVAILPIIYLALIMGLNLDSLKDIVGIDTSVLLPLNYIVMMIISVVFGSLYLFIISVVAIIKGENKNAKN